MSIFAAGYGIALHFQKRIDSGLTIFQNPPTEYALYSVPTTIAYRENVLGEEVPREIQTLDFIFASKEQYGSDARQNAANLGFYDSVIGWIIEQNSSRNFPEINEGQIKSIVPTLTQYVADADSDSAKYQIQIKVTYRRR